MVRRHKFNKDSLPFLGQGCAGGWERRFPSSTAYCSHVKKTLGEPRGFAPLQSPGGFAQTNTFSACAGRTWRAKLARLAARDRGAFHTQLAAGTSHTKQHENDKNQNPAEPQRCSCIRVLELCAEGHDCVRAASVEGRAVGRDSGVVRARPAIRPGRAGGTPEARNSKPETRNPKPEIFES